MVGRSEEHTSERAYFTALTARTASYAVARAYHIGTQGCFVSLGEGAQGHLWEWNTVRESKEFYFAMIPSDCCSSADRTSVFACLAGFFSILAQVGILLYVLFGDVNKIQSSSENQQRVIMNNVYTSSIAKTLIYN